MLLHRPFFEKFGSVNLHTALPLPCAFQESTIEFVAAKVSQLLAEDQQQEQQQEEALALSGASAGGGVDRTNDADYGKQEATAGRQQGTSSSADVGASGAGAGSTGGDGCGNERLGLPAPSGRETGSAGGRFKRMYLISTYTIGKERILMQVCDGQCVREFSRVWLVCAQ